MNDKRFYHYNKAEIYHNFSFQKLLENIENGGIMFDIRIGIHNSGKKQRQNARSWKRFQNKTRKSENSL